MNTIEDRRATFAELHESGCFVIPNPWDGSFIRAARGIAERGSFDGLDGAATFAELNTIFASRSPAAQQAPPAGAAAARERR